MERGRRIKIQSIDDSIISHSCKLCQCYDNCLLIANYNDGTIIKCIYYNQILRELKSKKKNLIEELKDGKYKFKENNND